MREIEVLANSALPVPMRASAGITSIPERVNTLVDSSNRNSATSLDSGRGSAYATSSEGSKMVGSISNSVRYLALLN